MNCATVETALKRGEGGLNKEVEEGLSECGNRLGEEMLRIQEEEESTTIKRNFFLVR